MIAVVIALGCAGLAVVAFRREGRPVMDPSTCPDEERV
jgi:hypothetical protein